MSYSKKRFYGLLTAAVVMLVIITAGVLLFTAKRSTPPEGDVYASDGTVPGDPEVVIRGVLAHRPGDASLGGLTIDYPLGGSVFPPEICAPTFLWHDESDAARAWLVDVTFEGTDHHVYELTGGRRTRRPLDSRCDTGINTYEETDHQASAKGWTPTSRTWNVIKRRSVESRAVVTIRGLDSDRRVVSKGTVTITTSADPVGAPIFYRDVPLMPSETKAGVIKPLQDFALPLIQWRLRDVSKREAPVVMQHLPTCANCHSFSAAGRTLGMDMDGPNGDKGAYAIKDVSRRMIITSDDVISWNRFSGKPKDRRILGLFAQLSPDGRYVITMVNELVYVANYADYRYLQTFYPTRGILAWYDRRTGEIRSLPGADDLRYVQGNPTWSPDGKTIIFLRAEARPNYGPEPRATHANDPRETRIQYDLYRIPFNDGRGGTPVPISGACGNGMSNSFPRVSPDGSWLVWVQCKNGMLMRPDSRLYIMPASGGKPRLMRCNTSNMNSWHSWSPNSRWLVFSSKVNTPYTQMFLTHIDEDGNDSPPILVPNSTAANRAVNLPEFVNSDPEAIVDITTPSVDYRRALGKARDLKKEGKVDEALAELRRSLELKDDYPETHVDVGDILLQQGKAVEAAKHYSIAFDIDSRNFYACNNLAAALGRQGRFAEAETCYRRALTLRPSAAKTHADLGAALIQLKKFDEAVECFRKALECDVRYVQAHYLWGVALRRQGRDEEAVARYRKMLEAQPQHLPAQYELGSLLLEVGRPADAAVCLRKALEINPRFFPAHHDLGIALRQTGKPREAVEHFREAQKINPHYALAANGLAWIFATHTDDAVRDGAEAVRQAELACRLTRNKDVGFLDTLAAAYAETGRFDDAVTTAGKSIALARSSGKTSVIPELESHLKAFRQKKPLRYAR